MAAQKPAHADLIATWRGLATEGCYCCEVWGCDDGGDRHCRMGSRRNNEADPR